MHIVICPYYSVNYILRACNTCLKAELMLVRSLWHCSKFLVQASVIN